MKRFLRIVALLFAVCAVSVAQQPVNNAQVAGSATSTAASGVQKVGIVGSTGSALDSTSAGTLDENVKTINNVTPLMGNGVSGTGSLRVNIASDNTAFAVNATLSAETTKVIGTVRNLGNAGAIMDFAGQNAAAPANAWLMGGEFNTSPTTITNGDASPLQLDANGKLLVNCTGCSAGSTVQLIPGTSGGVTLAHTVAAASTNATSLKASAGQVYDACVNSNAAYPVYFKLYNKASAPTVGTDTPVRVVEAQAGVPACIKTEEGYVFGTGIAWALTKGITDADATAVLISDATVEISYK